MSSPSKISSTSLRWNWFDLNRTDRKSSMEISPLLAMSACNTFRKKCIKLVPIKRPHILLIIPHGNNNPLYPMSAYYVEVSREKKAFVHTRLFTCEQQTAVAMGLSKNQHQQGKPYHHDFTSKKKKRRRGERATDRQHTPASSSSVRVETSQTSSSSSSNNKDRQRPQQNKIEP